jgi:sodium-dependent dicarboxylate transporter 2/3/5
MIVTAFLSLWISNTAATSMMLPIIDAVVKQLIKADKSFHNTQEMVLIKSKSHKAETKNELVA